MSMKLIYQNGIEEEKHFTDLLEFRYYLVENAERDNVKIIGYKRA